MRVSDGTAVAGMTIAGGLRGWFLRNVARPYPAQEFVPQIDGMRFVAIMAVVLYHLQGFATAKSHGAVAGGWLQALLSRGYFGVPLFFAISGYILCRPFLGGRKVSLKRYFVRRFTRLEPPYIISLLAVFALKVLVIGVAANDLFPNLLASLFYSHTLVYGTHSLVNGVAWSLEVEWQFYVLAPAIFACVVAGRSWARQAGLIAAMLIGGLAFEVSGDAGPRVALSLVGYFGFFLAGTWVAVLDEEHPEVLRGSVWMDLLGLMAAALILCVLFSPPGLQPALPGLTALLLVAGLRGRLARTVLGWWPIYCIGAMCYTIYLYHFFVISAAGRVFAATIGWPHSATSGLLAFGLFATLCVLMACMIPYLLIERPFMVWRPGKNQLWDAFRFLLPAKHQARNAATPGERADCGQ